MNALLAKPNNVKVAGIGVLVLLVLVGYFFVLSPRLSKAGEIKAEKETVAEQNDSRQTEITNLTKQAEGIARGRAQAAFLTGKFPPTAAQADLFAQIRKAAADAGLAENQVGALTPSVPQSGATTGNGSAVLPGQGGGPGLASMTVSLAATGTYAQLTAFLKNLENMDRAYLVRTVSLAPGGGNATGAESFAITIDGTMFVVAAPTDPDNYEEVMKRRVAAAPAVNPNAPTADSPAASAAK